MPSIISIIPARGGSKGIKEKNLQLVDGKSLVQIAIEASNACSSIKETYVSSDSEKILLHSRDLGVEIHERSSTNASCTASMLDTLKEFYSFYQSKKNLDDVWLLVLYPTYPFRTSEDLEKIIKTYLSEYKNFPHGIIGVKPASDHPYLAVKCDNDIITPAYNPDINLYYRRQKYPELWIICHWACLVPAKSLPYLNSQLFSEKTFPYRLERSPIDIDTFEDLKYANFLANSVT